jgi:ubiquinone/menaquinone biosynthesis C-methylase UbiE
LLRSIFRRRNDGGLKFFSKVDADPVPGWNHYFSFDLTKEKALHNRVIDVGCWTGIYVSLLADANPTYLVGVDTNKEALAIAKDRNPGADFVLCSVLCMPFAEETFDVATFWFVIEHIPRGTELAALAQINRLLRLGGTLFLSTESNRLRSKALDPAYFLTGHRHYSAEKLKNYLKGSHFETQEHFLSEGLFSCLSLILLYFGKHILQTSLRKNPFMDLAKGEYRKEGFKVVFFVSSKASGTEQGFSVATKTRL